MDTKSASGTRGIGRGASDRSTALPVSVHHDPGALATQVSVADLSSPQKRPTTAVSVRGGRAATARFKLPSFALLLVVVLVVVLGLISAGCGPPI